MPRKASIEVGSAPSHTLTVGFSTGGHRAYVAVDDTVLKERLSWEAPGSDWTLNPASLPEHPLQIQIRCAFEKMHYPHSHLLVARWGDARLVVASGADAESLARLARPAISL